MATSPNSRSYLRVEGRDTRGGRAELGTAWRNDWPGGRGRDIGIDLIVDGVIRTRSLPAD